MYTYVINYDKISIAKVEDHVQVLETAGFVIDKIYDYGWYKMDSRL